ncbi:MAG: histidine kinase, partial [Rhodothermales bacterium]
QLSEARLQTLRMQINPHFLFNTLHTISTYLGRDPKGARRMIARLSDLLRYTLEKAGTQEVTLRQELNFLDGYLEIQSIRFQDNLVVQQDVDPDMLEALVPNLILQPLVENAIKHGVSAVEGVGKVSIKAWRDNEQLCLSVWDNGPGMIGGNGVSASPTGLGLRNTRERLESLYGPGHHFELAGGAEGGVTALICIPYHTSADLYTASVTV